MNSNNKNNLNNTSLEQKQYPRYKNIIQRYFLFKKYYAYNWMHLFSLVVNAFIPFIILAIGISTAVEKHNAAYLWFSSWDTWTHQSNMLVAVFVWLSFFWPSCKVFKSNSYLVWITTYILITFLFFNAYVIMQATGLTKTSAAIEESTTSASSLPGHIAYIPKDSSSREIFYSVGSIFLHLINPISFVTYGITKMMLAHKKVTKNYFQFLFFGLLYPTGYMLYLIYIPWSGFADTGTSSYAVYGSFTQTKYNHLTWIWFPPLYLIFPIIGSIIWVFNYYGIKVTRKYLHHLWHKKEDRKSRNNKPIDNKAEYADKNSTE
ncbi:DUF1600 domain-containing protein [[Mycoplasma] testudinis]|uniref:DUF1600 domain-containing protein n=1 Tax=[Mycoplasma] testudinis TaxID=33924 RepID=UPI00048A3845|nr:DUF1600 domain-containing protein [[Mycoplasma] testudinis]